MHIVFRSAAGDRELDVELRSPGATLADLLRGVMGPHAPESVTVGDRTIAASCPIADSGLHEGAVLSTGAAPGTAVARADGIGLELVAVSGLDAGWSRPLAVGPATRTCPATSRGSSTRSSRPTTSRASRPRGAPGPSRWASRSTSPSCSPPRRRTTAIARSSASPTIRARRRSTRSAGISTRSTCCCSGSPVAARRRRLPASR